MKNPTQKLPEDELVTQHNALVHSRQTFTLLQQRILTLATAQIKRSHTGKEEYDIYIKDLLELGTSPDIYNHLEKQAKDLAGKVVTHKGIDEDGKRFFEHWAMIKKASYKEGTGVLKIQFHADIQQMLFDLKGQFSSAVAIEKASCQSVYSVRIYELLVSYWRFGKWEVSVDDLRDSLGLEDKYKNFSDFRQYVLEKAKEDLKRNTSMRFTWKEEKRARGRGKGKKVTHLLFDFSWNPNQMSLPMDDQPKPKFRDLPHNLLDRLKNDIGLNKKELKTVREWLEDRPDQDKPMNEWIYKKFVEDTNPKDSSGKQIRSYSKYFMSHFNETFQESGFPKKFEAKKVFAPDIPDDEK